MRVTGRLCAVSNVVAALAVVLAVTSVNGAPEPITFDIAPIAVAAADHGAPLRPPTAPATNDAGVVAYVAAQPDGATALLVHYPIGVLARVVGSGDPLAGSAVARLATMVGGLDPYGQVLFYAELADGRAGLFRASPPASPTDLTPTSGYRNQPLAFHLRGNGFAPGVQVRFGATPAGFIVVTSPTELTGIVRAGTPAGRVDVTVQRPQGAERSLPGAFEFLEPPVAGCRGLWPDHRPPVTASGVVSGWLVPGIAVGLYRLLARVRHRAKRR